MKTTAQNLADRIGISYSSANGLLRAFVELGLAEQVGTEREEGKRGKGKTIYQLAPKATSDLGAKLKEKLAA